MLLDWLTTLDDAELALCLRLRADVLWGLPVRDLEDLADRLSHPASVVQAVVRLSAPWVEVLEVLTALGDGASVDAAAELLERRTTPQEHRADVEAGVGGLIGPAAGGAGPGCALGVKPGLRPGLAVRLSAPWVEVLEVLTALGDGASVDAAAELLERRTTPQEHRADVEAVVEGLIGPALVVPGPDGALAVNPGLRQVFDAPLSLAPPA